MMRLDPAQLMALMEEDGPLSPQSLLNHGQIVDDKIQSVTDRYESEISAMLEGHETAHAAKVAELNDGVALLDVLTAELAAWACCDPAVATAIAVALERNASIECQATDETILFIDRNQPANSESCLTSIRIGDGVHWKATGRISVNGVAPDTIINAACGRRLREVMTHPILDRHDFHVTGVEILPMSYAFEIDADRTPLDGNTLACVMQRIQEILS